MSLKRSFAIVKKIFHDLKNDKRSLAFMFIAPIFAMVVFGLAFSGSVQNADLLLFPNLTQGYFRLRKIWEKPRPPTER